MKTVLIYDQIGMCPIQFAVINKDLSHLNDIYLNSTDCDEMLMRELSDLLYDDDGKEKVNFIQNFPVDVVKEGALVIVCGFLP